MRTLINPDSGDLDIVGTGGGGSGVTQIDADTGSALPSGGVVNILGGEGIDTVASGNSVTVSGENATAAASAGLANKGIASFNSANFTITSGFVSLSTPPSGITQILTSDGTPGVVPDPSGIVEFVPGEAIDITGNGPGNMVTIAAELATSSNIGVASFDSGDFTVTAGNVTLNSTGVGQTITGDTGGALAPTAGNWNILGGTGMDTSGAGSTLTVSFDVTEVPTLPNSFVTDSGSATPSANALNVLGTSAQGLSTSGAGATVTLTNADWTTSQKGVGVLATNAEAIAGTSTAKVITPDDLKAKLGTQTNHGVLVGAGTTAAVTALSVGATNTVLKGNTGADPSFGTIPNAALDNSSITLSNGNNITITGSPVSLGGAATVNVSGTTNHALQLGNATNSLTSLGVATNGQIPIGSTGVDPVLATITAGSSGNITITNGAGSITIDTTSPAPQASSLNFFEDFLCFTDLTYVGEFGWETFSTVATYKAPEASHPGIIQLGTGASSSGVANLYKHKGSAGDGSLLLGTGILTCEWMVRIPTLGTSAQRFTVRVGLSDEIAGTVASGVYFEYNDNVNSGKWTIVTNNASTSTVANTNSTPSANTWYKLKIIVNTGATSVSYYVDGVEVTNSPITTNIPTTNPIAPQVSIKKSVGSTSRTVDCDYCMFTYALTGR